MKTWDNQKDKQNTVLSGDSEKLEMMPSWVKASLAFQPLECCQERMRWTWVCLQLYFKLHEEYNPFFTTSRHNALELTSSCWAGLQQYRYTASSNIEHSAIGYRRVSYSLNSELVLWSLVSGFQYWSAFQSLQSSELIKLGKSHCSQ